MADFLENLSKDVEQHFKNIDNFNKDVLSGPDKVNKDLLASLGKTNDEIVANLVKLLGGGNAPAPKPTKLPSVEKSIPGSYNPYAD